MSALANGDFEGCGSSLISGPVPVIEPMILVGEKWSGRRVYHWLKHDLNFKTRGNKVLSLSGIFRILNNSFYYGMHEYPRSSGNFYEGKHKPIVDKELFDQAVLQLKREHIVRENREFAFTKLFTCGLCGSGVSAGEKFKPLKDGTTGRYIYYGCTRARDKNCKNQYIREDDLVVELLKIIDQMDINDLGIRIKFEEEIKRFNKFQKMVLGANAKQANETEVDLRIFAKYILQEGGLSEKRELMGNLRSRLVYLNKQVTLLAD